MKNIIHLLCTYVHMYSFVSENNFADKNADLKTYFLKEGREVPMKLEN